MESKTDNITQAKIDHKTVERAALLAELALSEEEKRQAVEDMNKMLLYMDKLNELDTEGVEPLAHLFRPGNVFREDAVKCGCNREDMLRNAPAAQNGMFQVPETTK